MSDTARSRAPQSPAPTRLPATLIALVTTAIGLVVLAWAVLFVTKGRFLRPTFERMASRALERQVRVGGAFEFYFAPFSLHVRADALRIANPAYTTRPDLFRADHLEAEIAPLSLIWGRRRFHWLELTNGAGDLEWSRDHKANSWTFGAPKPGSKPFVFPIIDRATVQGTTVRYRDPSMPLLADLKLDTIQSSAGRIGGDVHFSGGGTVRKTAFTTSGALLSPNETVGRGRNQLTLVADAAHNHLTVDGTLPSLADVERVPLAVTARGRNMAELLGIIGVGIPLTRDYHLRARMVKDGDEYAFTRMRGTFGASDLAGRLTVTNGRRVHLDSALTTRRLDIIDAAPFIGFDPDIVESKGAIAAAAATGAAPLRILPDAALPVATMRVFDADLHWTIQTVRSRNLPVSDIDLTLNLDHGRLALSPFSFAMARGHVASDMVFDTRARPAADSYDIRLSPTPLARLLAGYGVAEAGTSGTVKGRIQLAGRGDTIHASLASAHGRIAFVLPRGSFWTRNVQLAELDLGTFAQKMFQHRLKEPVAINCGLVAFSVRNGIGAADPILIDTSKSVMLGRGGFSFRNETLDLAFRADGKKFSLFSGQSPIGINGYFAKPGVQVISKQLLGRAGVGLGLAALVAPPAALLAFVDVGDAKAAACGPVLAAATASAQRDVKGRPRDDVGHGTTAKEENGKASSGERKGQRKKFLGIF